MKSPRAILVTAPTSDAGKTTVTLGLLRLLKQRGIAVRSAKSGPDYIDPTYHLSACKNPCVNLDAWSMSTQVIRDLAFHDDGPDHAEFVIIEGAMGAIDGAGSAGAGSTADLAEILEVPVILVVSAERVAQSSILPFLGLRGARPNLQIAGLIANRVASERHALQIKTAADRHGVPLLGCLRRCPDLNLHARHLGLVPAGEHDFIEAFLEHAADRIAADIDVDAVLAAARPLSESRIKEVGFSMPPLGQRIAVAHDDAFVFTYRHLLIDWKRQGVEIQFFSPLADEPPPVDCDSVYLPGGYPELHAYGLAAARQFRHGMAMAADHGKFIYGECGGFMVLGQTLEDKNRRRHRMLELLSHSSSFAKPTLHLGYRRLQAPSGSRLSGTYMGHEFHYAALENGETCNPLFTARDADGKDLPGMGETRGSVSGSFAHLICRMHRDRCSDAEYAGGLHHTGPSRETPALKAPHQQESGPYA